MGLIAVDIRFEVKTPQWVIDHPSTILDPGEPLFLTNMTFTLGDAIGTPLSGLTFSPVGSSIFAADILVSLFGGKTLGKYVNGDTIPAAGKTAEEVMRMIAIEDIAPIYTIPTLVLTKSATTKAEVGTSYSHNLTGTFTQNDAGPLTDIEIKKNGVTLGVASASSPLVRPDSGNYVLGNISYAAHVSYDAGAPKNYLPSGTVDQRTPAIRSVNAPQAADPDFVSNTLLLTGAYLIFFGDSTAAPVNSANVRALANNRFTDAGNTFTLNTGDVNKIFSVCIPATMSLSSVIDLDALNADITANYIVSTFNVNDAGGNPVSYKVYTMTNAVAYPSNHRHQITVS